MSEFVVAKRSELMALRAEVSADNSLAFERITAMIDRATPPSDSAKVLVEALEKCVSTFEFFESVRGSKGALAETEETCRSALAAYRESQK